MGVSIAVSKSWVCLNLIEVGTIKKYQPHPETVCSTSLTFTKALAAEMMLSVKKLFVFTLCLTAYL